MSTLERQRKDDAALTLPRLRARVMRCVNVTLTFLFMFAATALLLWLLSRYIMISRVIFFNLAFGSGQVPHLKQIAYID